MKKVIVALVIVVLVVLAVLLIYPFSSPESQETSAASSQQQSGASSAPSQGQEEQQAVPASGQTSASETPQASPSETPRLISLHAARFQYTPNVITVKKGERVKITLTNTDTTHGIVIPDLSVSGIDSVEFTPDRAGTFEFRCPTFCGSGHGGMKGTLIVEE